MNNIELIKKDLDEYFEKINLNKSYFIGRSDEAIDGHDFYILFSSDRNVKINVSKANKIFSFNDKVVEGLKRNGYCNSNYIPMFVRKGCNLMKNNGVLRIAYFFSYDERGHLQEIIDGFNRTFPNKSNVELRLFLNDDNIYKIESVRRKILLGKNNCILNSDDRHHDVVLRNFVSETDLCLFESCACGNYVFHVDEGDCFDKFNFDTWRKLKGLSEKLSNINRMKQDRRSLFCEKMKIEKTVKRIINILKR